MSVNKHKYDKHHFVCACLLGLAIGVAAAILLSGCVVKKPGRVFGVDVLPVG